MNGDHEQWTLSNETSMMTRGVHEDTEKTEGPKIGTVYLDVFCVCLCVCMCVFCCVYQKRKVKVEGLV